MLNAFKYGIKDELKLPDTFGDIMKQLLAAIALGLFSLTAVADVQIAQTEAAPVTDSEQLLTLEEIDEKIAVQTQVMAAKPEKQKKLYASALIGIGAYPEVNNVDKGYNASIAAGYYFGEQLMFEVGFGVAKSQLNVKNQLYANQRDNFDINQYQGNLAAKYRLDGLFGSNFRPQLGLVVSYTYRKFSQTSNLILVSGNTGSSTAMDGGLGGGIDYDLNRSFSLGLDYRYMFNISNQVNANYVNPSYGYRGTSIESLQYYVAGVAARMSF